MIRQERNSISAVKFKDRLQWSTTRECLVNMAWLFNKCWNFKIGCSLARVQYKKIWSEVIRRDLKMSKVKKELAYENRYFISFSIIHQNLSDMFISGKQMLNEVKCDDDDSVFVFLCPLLFPCRGGRKQDLSSVSKTDQADFTDWMFFLPSNLMEEISLILKPSTQILQAFHQHTTLRRQWFRQWGIHLLI